MISSIQNFDYQGNFNSSTKAANTFLKNNWATVRQAGSKFKNVLTKVSKLAKPHFTTLSKKVGDVLVNLKTLAHKTFKNLSDVADFVRKNASPAVEEARSLLSKHQEKIAGGVVLGVCVYALYRWSKSKPQISPENVHTPVALTFCLDGVVNLIGQSAVKKIAAKILSKDGAHVKNEANIMIRAMHRESWKGKSISNIENISQLDSLDLITNKGALEALDSAATELKCFATDNPHAKQTLVLITDEQSTLNYSPEKIHKILAEIKVQVYVIGIGRSHNEKTLRDLASSSNFEGTYIDEKEGDEVSLEEKLSTIFANCLQVSFKEGFNYR